jgi:uracil-DNA glycosylase
VAEHEEGAEPWVPQQARTPAELARAAEECRGCELWEDTTQAVVGSGPVPAPLMLVGEQPGDQEDKAGEPFVGPAGRLVRDALEQAGLEPADVFFTNAVKHFRHERRGKRRIHQKPDVRHLRACHPWLTAELALVEPEVVVCLGATAARAVLGRTVRIGAEHGAVLAEQDVPATVVTYHPSAVLRRKREDEQSRALEQALVADLAVAGEAAGFRSAGGR